MQNNRLRVYFGPEESDSATIDNAGDDSSTVSATLGEVLPLLIDAVRSDRTWLEDFKDDKVTLSADLYEVILAYQHFRRPSA